MDARRDSDATPTKPQTTVEQRSDRELVVTRTVNGPAHLVFEAWTRADLFRGVLRHVPRGHAPVATLGQLDALLASLGSAMTD
jgi:hypothetical protein